MYEKESERHRATARKRERAWERGIKKQGGRESARARGMEGGRERETANDRDRERARLRVRARARERRDRETEGEREGVYVCE